MTDFGLFIVQLAASSNSAPASLFSIYRSDGSLLSDRTFLELINSRLPELQPLTPIFDNITTSPPERSLARGLIVGSDWSDYRLPAAPSLFVGRRELAAEIEEHILQHRETNIIQIKSRSGVGKSSLLAYLDTKLIAEGCHVELHDVRDVKSVFDVFSLIQRFSGARLPAADMKDVEYQLRTLANTISGKSAVFMVDQFESTFNSREIFDAYENIALLIFGLRPRIYMVFTRKSDQLTTHDDNQVSLERMNSLSTHKVLQDFVVQEAAELIDKINNSAPKPFAKEIKSYVLEFAQGFPWLIKRTMAHVVHLASTGTSQDELVAADLRLEELFEEELQGLDELEKDYLTRIATRLPANVQQLQQEFDEDPLLKRILDKLIGNRLLRLSGATYDTYNDVFKEFLIYRKLPQFRQAFVYRMGPAAVMKLFHKLIKVKRFTIEQLETDYSLPKGSAFNLVREMRALGLLKRDAQAWYIPRNVLDVYDRGSLGEYIRRQLVSNGVVADLVAIVAKNGSFSVDNLPTYLEQRFVFVSASHRTWRSYARILGTWLEKTLLLSVVNGHFVQPEASRSDILGELGNLSNIVFRASVKKTIVFIPSVQWRIVEEAAQLLLNKQKAFNKQLNKGLSDLRNLGLIIEDELQFKELSEVRKVAREMLQREDYNSIWSNVNLGKPITAPLRLILGNELHENTLRWKAKVIRNWGRELGITPTNRKQRHKDENIKQLNLLDQQ